MPLTRQETYDDEHAENVNAREEYVVEFDDGETLYAFGDTELEVMDRIDESFPGLNYLVAVRETWEATAGIPALNSPFPEA